MIRRPPAGGAVPPWTLAVNAIALVLLAGARHGGCRALGNNHRAGQDPAPLTTAEAT